MSGAKQKVLSLLQAGRFSEAKATCEAWGAGSDDPEAWFLLAGIEAQSGNLEAVVSCCRKVIDHRPDNVAAHYNQGVALQGLGRAGEAVQSYRAALKLDPAHVTAHANLALALRDLDNPREAKQHCETALRFAPSLAQAHNTLGLIHSDLEELDAAMQSFHRAIQFQPDYAEAHYNLGLWHEHRHQWDEASRCFMEALRLKPDYAAAHNDLGNVLKARGKTQEALASYRRAVELRPDRAEGFNNLGVALLEQNRLEEAVESFQHAIAVQPDNARAHNNLANARVLQNRIDDALAGFDRALVIEPDYVEAHWNLSLALLLDGDFDRGWREYEWRWRRESVIQRPFSWSRWDGSSLAGKTLLVYAEQGIGDEIMFASCLPDALAQAGHVVIDCDPRLTALFRRSFPGASVHGSVQDQEPAWLKDAPPIDAQVPIGGLSRHLRAGLTAFPRRQGYLAADPGLKDIWRDRYAKLGESLKIGISWRGGGIPAVKIRRSTTLDQWREVLNLPDAHFINLQYGDTAADIKQARETVGVLVHDWEDSDPLKDMDHFAAKIAMLDLVITVDNSTAHMAGALGVTAWVLQPFAPDWRWLREREDSPWYPSVRLFRAASPGDWEGVFSRIVQSLSQAGSRDALLSRGRH